MLKYALATVVVALVLIFLFVMGMVVPALSRSIMEVLP